MSDITITPNDLAGDALVSQRISVTPAIIGAMGAALGLYASMAFLVVASLPMSVLGVVRSLRIEPPGSVVLGGFGVACAIAAVLDPAVL